MIIFTLAKSFILSKIRKNYSRKIILKLQEKKMRKQLLYAFENSSFYYDLYTSNGISRDDLYSIDLDKIPTVDKEMIMDHFDEVVTVNDITKDEILEFLDKSTNPDDLFKNRYHILHTSGSSGKLGIFVYSRREWDTFYPYITNVFDFSLGKHKSAFVGAVGGHFTGASFISWCSNDGLDLFCEPLIIDVNDPLDDIIQRLNDFQPDILGGYFNALKVLAQKQEENELQINPKILTNCGEGLNQKDKTHIENVFQAPMSNLYSFAECYVLGFGKKEYDGIYLRDDLCLVEIKKDHILITNLVNKVEPLIRYRIDDFITPKKDTKKQLPFTLIDTVVGRAEFVIWFENEQGKMDFIHPLIFTDFYVKGLDKLQIAIKSKTSFEFRAVITNEDKKRVLDEIKEKLDKILKDKHFTNVNYEIKEYDSLDPDEKTRKFSLIVDET